MLTIIVVDDEHLTHRGLKAAIDWEKYGFQIIGDAKNGEEGLELALKLRPDIIITDVCMPNMDGLEMISHIREHNYNPKIIVISAFDEFHYVKRALESKAIAYLLKPIKDNELIKILLEQKKIIENENKMKSEIANYHENLAFLKERFFIELFNGKVYDEELLEKKLKSFNIPDNLTSYFIIKIGLDAHKELTKNNETDKLLLLKQELQSQITKSFSKICDFEFNFMTDEKTFAVILFTNSKLQYITEQCKILGKTFFRNTQSTISIGISNCHYSLAEASIAYIEATDAWKYKSVKGRNSVIQISDINDDSQQANLTQSEINSIITCIKSHKAEDTFQHLNELFNRLKEDNSSIDYVKEICVQLSVLANNTLNYNNDAQQNELLLISSKIHELETVYDVFECTKHFIDDILNSVLSYDANLYRKDVQLAINYIKKNYSKQITAEQVANELFISYHYLMHIFTRDVGKTFNEYLTDYRIEVAKNMLKNKNQTIAKVSELVGYKSSKYFGILFKKKTGLTPKEYAEQ